MPETLTVDDLVFEVRRSPRRRSMQITVDRRGELLLSGPAGCDVQRLERFVRDKKAWIYGKLALKQTFQQALAGKEFVSGEGFSYLGRNYRLLLVDSQGVPLKLEGGRLKLLRSEAIRGRAHLVRWYCRRAEAWVGPRMAALAARVGVTPKGLRVTDLGHRWGSCGREGTVNLHWATILLPPSAIEYVVVHELVHLLERHHTPEFWLRVERAMPDFERRRAWLAERGGGMAAL